MTKRLAVFSRMALVAVALAVGAVATGKASQRITALSKLKVALTQAEPAAPLSGYPAPPWSNPYAAVLHILRANRTDLPRIWQARALAQYAVYVGILAPANSQPHSHAWYRHQEEVLLLQAVKICPVYASGWAQLAYLYWHKTELCRQKPRRQKLDAAFHHYLALALRVKPLNPWANGLRAMDIDVHHQKSSGPYTGNLGFRSRKWIRAFCYRALVFLKYEGAQTPLGFARLRNTLGSVGGMSGFESAFFRPALKYYEPKQLAELDAGVWKPPAKCPDPWPPQKKKAANIPATTRP